MSEIENATGGVGVVHVGDMLVTVAPLSTLDEKKLWKTFRAAAIKRAKEETSSLFDGPNVKRLLQSMAAASPQAYLESVRELTRIAADRDRAVAKGEIGEDEVFGFRASPQGVAIELFERGKASTPGLVLESLKAVITDANLDDVGTELYALIEAGRPKETRSASPS